MEELLLDVFVEEQPTKISEKTKSDITLPPAEPQSELAQIINDLWRKANRRSDYANFRRILGG